jgi:hypothetical protein
VQRAGSLVLAVTCDASRECLTYASNNYTSVKSPICQPVSEFYYEETALQLQALMHKTQRLLDGTLRASPVATGPGAGPAVVVRGPGQGAPTAPRPCPGLLARPRECGLDRHRCTSPPCPGAHTGAERFLPWRR